MILWPYSQIEPVELLAVRTKREEVPWLVEALAGEQFNFVSGTLGSRRPTVHLSFR